METVFICTIFGVFLCISFYLGAKIGKNLTQNKPIEIPNPIKKATQIKKDKAELEELQKLETIWQNIENYDGTSAKQKEV